MTDTSMKRKAMRRPGRHSLLRVYVCCVLLLIAGCASTPDKEGAPDASTSQAFSDLYDGKSTVTYATEFPVASAEEARQRGDLALRQGDLDLALYQYIQALELQTDGDDVGTLARIGAIHASRGNLELAEIAYRRAVVIDPDNAAALTGLGLILLKKRDNATAGEMLNHSIEVVSRQWRAHNALGIIADLEGEHPRAIAHYQAALNIQPTSPLLLNNLGYSYYLSEDWPAALAMFRQALDEDPNYKLAWQNLGLLYAREEQYTAAVDAFSHAMELSQAYNDVGYLSMLDGHYELSEAFLEEAIKLSPSYYKTANQNMVRVRMLKAASEAEHYPERPAR